MQDPSEDTEWNDILRSKGILPQKEITEEQVVSLVEETVKEKQGALGKELDKLSLDELDELEDDEDEKVILEFRNRRLAELKAAAAKANYGELREISGQDYVDEVNKAGKDVWVVLHLYKQGIPLCALINNHLSVLAKKFPATKFLRSISSTCIANYPDKNLPTIFIYHEGNMKKQFIGPLAFRGLKLTCDELEWLLSESGAVKSDLEEDPRPKVRDVLFSDLKNGQNIKNYDDDDDDAEDDSIDDW